MEPPHYIDYKQMAKQARSLDRNKYNIARETFNEYFLVPHIMLHLYAGFNNKYTKEVTCDDKLVKLIEYCLRFHFGAESGQNSRLNYTGHCRHSMNFSAETRHILMDNLMESLGLVASTLNVQHVSGVSPI